MDVCLFYEFSQRNVLKKDFIKIFKFKKVIILCKFYKLHRGFPFLSLLRMNIAPISKSSCGNGSLFGIKNSKKL